MNKRKYEALYIVSGALNDSEVKAIADRFKNTVETQGGQVDKAEKWEKRKLAYEINGHKDGNYIIMHFDAESKVPAELSRQMRISDDVIRHRIYVKQG